tara:strand:+ start:599 stop:1285 length:687 start_codon:yes stop_codon:yes gene_type:complete
MEINMEMILNNIYYFILFCGLVRSSYFITDIVLKNTTKKYLTLDNDKQQYVQKNIVKSINLACLTVYGVSQIIYPVVMYNTWDNNIIHICGVFYSSNDFVALLYVNKLSQTTKNHHKITVFLSFVALTVDFKTSTFGKMMFIYTFSSTATYLVNTYLGIRFLYEKDDLTIMKRSARNIYGVSLLLNWCWHIQWCINNFNLLGVQHYLYFLLLFFIIKDDVLLFKWLCA